MDNIKAFLFDMDGVLVNSEEVMLKAAMSALLEFGIETKPEDFEEFVGAGEDKYVGGTAEKYGYAYDINMKHRAYALYGELVKEQPIAYDGVVEVLTELKSRGYKIAVCSSADMVKVKCNLEAMGLGVAFFDYLVSGDEIQNKKPFPDIYLAASKHLDIPPQECLVVEDAINGIQAAKSAKMHNAAITTSFTKEKLISEINPEYIIDDIRELLAL